MHLFVHNSTADTAKNKLIPEIEFCFCMRVYSIQNIVHAYNTVVVIKEIQVMSVVRITITAPSNYTCRLFKHC